MSTRPCASSTTPPTPICVKAYLAQAHVQVHARHVHVHVHARHVHVHVHARRVHVHVLVALGGTRGGKLWRVVALWPIWARAYRGRGDGSPCGSQRVSCR